MRRLAPVLLATLPLLLAACGDDAEPAETGIETVPTGEDPSTTAADDTTTSTEAEATTATEAETTTTTAETTTTTTADEGDGPAIPTDPAAYATAFVAAWASGDQATAEVLGSADAVATIFAFESGGPDAGWALQGECDGAAGSSFCTFSAGGDPTVVVRVLNEAASLAQPQAVSSVQVSG